MVSRILSIGNSLSTTALLRRCRGCHNPATLDVNGGKVFDVGEIITQFKDRPIISGITLTGGEESISFDDVASLFGGGE